MLELFRANLVPTQTPIAKLEQIRITLMVTGFRLGIISAQQTTTGSISDHLHWNWRFYRLIITGTTPAFGLTMNQPPTQRTAHGQAD
jgi:thioester reductase-like protein